MLFGKNYDRALWLMIAADKKSREQLVEFLRNIPEELYRDIRDKIAKNEEYNRNKVRFCDREEKHLTGHFVAVNGLVYRFGIDSANGALDMAAYTNYNGYENVTYSITLVPYDSNKPLECFESQHLGNFAYEVFSGYDLSDSDMDFDSCDYSLVKMPIGHIVTCSVTNSILKKRSRAIDLKRMPSEIKLINLRNQDRINRLVRGRRRI